MIPKTPESITDTAPSVTPSPASAVNVAIARACGVVKTPDEDYPDCFLYAGTVWPLDDWPDYRSDLNAMHEAEKILKGEEQWRRYLQFLTTPDSINEWWPGGAAIPFVYGAGQVHATAEQKAEAFLRTLNLWPPATA